MPEHAPDENFGCASKSLGTKPFHEVQGAATTEGAAGTEPVAADLDKAKALGNALLICMALPWFLCFVFYSGAARAFSLLGPAAQACLQLIHGICP